jgi:GDPmannose 4,6-dehydratase
LYACNGILFNHESPVRGETFVTRKITRAAARISMGTQEQVYLGNLDAKRDWGHASDFVDGMWRILQQEKPEDFVLATGVTTTIREFAERAFAEVGITLEWSGSDVDEVGRDVKTGKTVVLVDQAYFRPTEVDLLVGDASKAREKLGWVPTCDLQQMIKEMIAADLEEAHKDQHLHSGGFQTNSENGN